MESCITFIKVVLLTVTREITTKLSDIITHQFHCFLLFSFDTNCYLLFHGLTTDWGMQSITQFLPLLHNTYNYIVHVPKRNCGSD